jgi:tRNA-2-methylthio-N6-dimethylallyladenosine synthase
VGDSSWIGRFADIKITQIRSMNLVEGELVSLETLTD